ncbi:MAG: hypothetical protein FWB85_11525 [Chitinispirillia bacterium]|nr:hypothetical protein [Chitinispirillia bacterium]
MPGIFRGAARTALVMAVMLMLGVAGCVGAKTGPGDGGPKNPAKKGKPLNEADQNRLDEARKAAEAAETELSDLRLERIKLEGGGQ